MVYEASRALKDGANPTSLYLDTSLTTLHNHSIGWLVDAYEAVNKPEIIKKVCCMSSTSKELSSN